MATGQELKLQEKRELQKKGESDDPGAALHAEHGHL